MHKNVELLIGRLATDSTLRRRFAAAPAAVLGELRERGCELTSVELDALAGIEPRALHSFAASLDRRLRKADRVGERDATTLSPPHPTDHEKENQS